MLSRRSSYLPSILVLLFLLLPGCSKKERKFTQEDYLNIKIGMTQADVETTLGKSETIAFDQAAHAILPLTDQRNVYQTLSWRKWGTGKDLVLAGFSTDGKARAKAFKIYNAQGVPISAAEPLGNAFNKAGKIEWTD